MGETEVHRDDMIDLIQTLEDWFANEPMVWVSGNMPISYEEGNPGKHIAPDVFVETHPDQLARGIDAQLERAVEVVLADLGEWKKKNTAVIAIQPPPTKPIQPVPMNPTKRDR